MSGEYTSFGAGLSLRYEDGIAFVKGEKGAVSDIDGPSVLQFYINEIPQLVRACIAQMRSKGIPDAEILRSMRLPDPRN